MGPTVPSASVSFSAELHSFAASEHGAAWLMRLEWRAIAAVSGEREAREHPGQLA